MSIYSDINMNASHLSDKVMETNMQKNRVKGPGDDLLVDRADLNSGIPKEGIVKKISKWFKK